MFQTKVLSYMGALLGLLAWQAHAGQYTNNFNSYALYTNNFGDGSAVFSSAPGNSVARVDDGTLYELQLSQWDATNNRSAFLLPDLDPGKSIRYFTAGWISPVYGNFPNAGSGFSFNFGPLRTTNLVSTNVLQELGYGAGLTLSVRTGSSSPGLSLFCNNVLVAGPVTNNPTATWGVFSATRHAFQVSWSDGSGVSVSMDGAAIFTNVVLTNYVPAAGDSFVWAARAGVYGETYRIDNVTVTTGLGAPLLQSVVAANTPALPQVNLSAQVNPNGLPTTTIVEFGTNLSYGTSVTNLLPLTSDFVPVAVSFPTTAVYPAVLHVRITVSNLLGTVTSGDLAFNALLFQKTYSSDLLNQGTPYLSPIAGAVGWLDFNNDGLLDLTVSGRQEDQASAGYIYYNQGTNPVRWPFILTPNGFKSSLAIGDMDNDNRPDVFFATDQQQPGSLVPHTTSVYGGASGILFGSDTTYGGSGGTAGSTARTNIVMFPSTNGTPQLDSGLYVYDSTTVMCDLDHDGRQDLLVTGWRNTVTPGGTAILTNFSAIYWNNFVGGKRPTATLGGYPTNTMPPVHTSIPLLGYVLALAGWDYFGQNSLAISDLNGDGLPDLFCAGLLNQFNNSKSDKDYGAVYLGDGDGGFTQTGYYAFDTTEATEAYNQTTESSVLADLNGDGKPDLVFSFVSGDDYRTHAGIWFNDGSGNFTNSGIVLPHLELVNVAAGDLFNHGRNDIVLSGYTDRVDPNGATAPIGQTFILRNDGGGVFTTFDLGLIGTACEQGTGVKLADYDNDGRLDIAMAGGYWSFSATHILRNVIGNIPSNSPPAAPTGLTTTVGSGTVSFHWNQATDDITPVNQLTYNLRVGTNSLGTQTVSPLADVVTGWRKIAQPGNCWGATNTTYHFPPGTYYWSVQAVDGGFKGGAWGAEQTFTITDPEPVKLNYTQTGTANNLTWSLRRQGYTVETKSALNDTAWVSNAVAVDTMNGKWFQPVTNNAPSGFYRLRK